MLSFNDPLRLRLNDCDLDCESDANWLLLWLMLCDRLCDCDRPSETSPVALMLRDLLWLCDPNSLAE